MVHKPTEMRDNKFHQGSMHSHSNAQANDVEAQMHHRSAMIIWNLSHPFLAHL